MSSVNELDCKKDYLISLCVSQLYEKYEMESATEDKLSNDNN